MSPHPRLVAALSLLLLPLIAPAAPITYTAVLSGSNEVPVNNSTATGLAIVTYDSATHLLSVSVTFSGLIGGAATASHIHAPASPGTNAPVAVAFTGFPNATTGTYSNSFDLTLLSTYTSAFVTANGGTAASAETALANDMASDLSYVNIHNATFPGGEIRGTLRVPDVVSTVLLLGPALFALFYIERSRRLAVR